MLVQFCYSLRDRSEVYPLSLGLLNPSGVDHQHHEPEAVECKSPNIIFVLGCFNLVLAIEQKAS